MYIVLSVWPIFQQRKRPKHLAPYILPLSCLSIVTANSSIFSFLRHKIIEAYLLLNIFNLLGGEEKASTTEVSPSKNLLHFPLIKETKY